MVVKRKEKAREKRRSSGIEKFVLDFGSWIHFAGHI